MMNVLKIKFMAVLLALIVLPVGSAMACPCDGSDKDDEETVTKTQ